MSKDRVIFLLFILLVAIFPIFSESSYTIGIATFAGINSLVAIGLCILMGYAGQVSLGQAGFSGIGAYVSAILSINFGLPVVLSVIISLVVAGLSAVVLAIPALRLKGHYLAVATLGFGEIIHVILNEWGPGGPSGFGDITRFNVFGYTFSTPISYYLLIWSTVMIVMLFSINLIKSRFGRALRSIHDSELASSAMGVNVSTLKIKVFVLSAVYAALGGALYAHYVTFISPSSFSLFQSILLLMMVVVGGITNLWGAVVGAIIITILPELLREFKEYDILVYGVILILTLLFFNKGLVPIIIEKLSMGKR
ncbi:MAG: branched-chain amino acid ABC transporter permease [Thermodesulfovibrionales bacterium]